MLVTSGWRTARRCWVIARVGGLWLWFGCCSATLICSGSPDWLINLHGLVVDSDEGNQKEEGGGSSPLHASFLFVFSPFYSSFAFLTYPLISFLFLFLSFLSCLSFPRPLLPFPNLFFAPLQLLPFPSCFQTPSSSLSVIHSSVLLSLPLQLLLAPLLPSSSPLLRCHPRVSHLPHSV